MDKKTLKILRLLYKKSQTQNEIVKLFKVADFEKIRLHFVLLENCKFTTFSTPDSYGAPTEFSMYNITLQGRDYIENYRKETFDRRFTRSLSIIAVIISILTFLFTCYIYYMRR